jgi:hypothetical protein
MKHLLDSSEIQGGAPLWLALLLALLVSVPPATGAEPLARGEVSSSEYCGLCHRDIHRLWKSSAHARSMEGTVFLSSYRDTERRLGGEAVRPCLSCHAPLAELSSDWALERKTTWEGVSCDVCHSMTAVDQSGPHPRMRLDVGPVKRGPIRDAASTAHEVAYSELHTQAIACAPCHEFVNSEGTAIMTTYSEWEASKASQEGVGCQQCHMGTTDDEVVDPRSGRQSHAKVNTHEVPGGHSLEQLNKALRLSLQPKRQGNRITVDVKVINRGAGHAVPTGMPGRRIVLSVSLSTASGTDQEKRRVYAKSFADAEGRAVAGVTDHFAPGVQLVSDTRIQPDERRSESFEFSVPEDQAATLTVKLFYEHDPTGREDDRTWLTFYTERRTLPRGRSAAS